LQLSPDGKHVFVVLTERTETAKRPNVPNYVTESSYTEDIPARTFVGDAQDKRVLSVMNLETGKTVSADLDEKNAKDTTVSAGSADRDGTKDTTVLAGSADLDGTKDTTVLAGSADL